MDRSCKMRGRREKLKKMVVSSFSTSDHLGFLEMDYTITSKLFSNERA
jgi:hypothetical protein